MKLIICFIDDSDFEHDLIRHEVAPSVPDLTFVQAHTFDEARGMLGKEIPLLFLLDLWGQDPAVKDPILTPRAELEKRVSQFNTLGAVYEGLESFEGDQTNEYLKRLFTIVDGWRNLFEQVCGRIGQNRKYGLANLRRARKYYPGVPVVFYTRKSLISDAVAMFQAGADGLFIKPTGRDDTSTRLLTKEYGPKLTEALALLIDRHISALKTNEAFYQANPMNYLTDLDALIASWRNFRKSKKTSMAVP
ncbi:MAG: response regulator [Desulfobacteraceae bacterium]